MATSVAEIWNLTLSNLGQGSEVQTETENTDAANACRRFYETARDATLRDFMWPFATKRVALGLVAELDDDDLGGNEWSFSYRYPSDCLRIVRFLSGIRNDTRKSRVPFKIERDATGLLIYCDLEDAEIEYIMRETDVSRFPSDFVMALAWRLAAYIAPRLTAGDPFGLGRRALQMYALEISNARAMAANEQQDDELPESEFIRIREGETGGNGSDDWQAFPDRSTIT